MIPIKVKFYLEEYINQEVYVQIAVIKGKEKISIKLAIKKYIETNHFKDLSQGKPYDHFINGLKDKCLGKLKDSPMRNKETTDSTIKELQNQLNNLSNDELDNTFWEIETGEFLNKKQIYELEKIRDDLVQKLTIQKNNSNIYETIINICKGYEELCQKKYPETPLPLEIKKLEN